MRTPILILMFAIIGGCTASYTQPSLTADHPGSPSAEEAPASTRWQTLDLAAADPVTPAKAPAGMGHSEHEMGNIPANQPSSPGIDHPAHKPDAPVPTPGGAPAMYACPMHPEVTSDKPDQRCPKCGMKLKPAAKSGGAR